MTRFLLISALSALMLSHAKADNQSLPNVLLIGDSISIGYTKPVQNSLKGEAHVVHHKGNAGPTSNGLAKLDNWLGETKWDVIHFNWGLHDLCYRHPDSKVQGNRDKVHGTIMVPLKDYEKNLEILVQRLKKTNARLIWASTTVVPEGEAGRHAGDEIAYNKVAKRIMDKHGIPINDLYALTKTFKPELFLKPGDVHYKAEGKELQGKQVAEAIRQALK